MKDVGQLDPDTLIAPIENFIPKKAVTNVETSETQNTNETHLNNTCIEQNQTENTETSNVNETVVESLSNQTELDTEDPHPTENIVHSDTGEQVNDFNLVER